MMSATSPSPSTPDAPRTLEYVEAQMSRVQVSDRVPSPRALWGALPADVMSEEWWSACSGLCVRGHGSGSDRPSGRDGHMHAAKDYSAADLNLNLLREATP